MSERHEPLSPEDLRRPRANIAQSCELAGVSRRTIYVWMKAGKVEYVRTAGGLVRIFTDTLLRRERDE